VRYDLTLWGGGPGSIKIFWFQKKVLRIIGYLGQHVSYRNFLKIRTYFLCIVCI
jgi:hypothetical protein